MGFFDIFKKKKVNRNNNFRVFEEFLTLQKAVKPNKEKLEELKNHYMTIKEDKDTLANFLNLIGVNASEYRDLNLGNDSWLHRLASKNEIILLNNNADTYELIQKLNNYKNGMFANLGREYKKDHERLELAKDIMYFLHDILSDLCPLFDLIYIHTENKNEFFIAFILQKNISKVLKLSESLKLKIIRIFSWYPNKNEYEDKFQKGNYGITSKDKNVYNKERNEKYINPLKAKKIEERNKKINRLLSKDDEEKFYKIAQSVYNDISKYGLSGINDKNPNLKIKSFVVNVIKILLANKLLKKQEIIDLEINEGFFFHWIEDGENMNTEKIINELLDKIEEMN